MSASAFAVSELGTVLLSEGIAYYPEGKIAAKNARKVWKLSNSVGLTWMGKRPSIIDELATSTKGLNGKTAIHRIAKILEISFKDRPEVLKHLEDHPYNIFTFQCRQGYTEYWRLFYPEDKFTPIYKGNLKPGMSGALVVDVTDNTPFQKMANKLWPKYKKRFASHEEALEAYKRTNREAFIEMVDMYKAEGKRVGGEIFMETIRPS